MHWVLFFLSQTVAFGQNLYSIQFQGYPKDQGQCADRAHELGVQFAKASNAQVYSAVSESNTPEACQIRLHYAADTELPYISTQNPDPSSEPWMGVFLTRKDCEANVVKEVDLFESQTGVKHWLAYCQQKRGFGKQFQVRVDGFGSSDIRLRTATAITFEAPLIGWGKAIEEMKAELDRRHVIVSSFIADDISGSPDLSLRFYAKEKAWLQERGYAPHREAAVCDAQLPHVRANFEKSSPAPLGVFCGKDEFSRNKLVIVTLSAKADSDKRLVETMDSKIYGTLDECVKSLPATETFYHDTLKKNVITGFCGGEAKRFQISIFETVKI